jgi:hypothetical protein
MARPFFVWVSGGRNSVVAIDAAAVAEPLFCGEVVARRVRVRVRPRRRRRRVDELPAWR